MRLIFVNRFNGRFRGNLFEQFIEGLLRKFKYISNKVLLVSLELLL